MGKLATGVKAGSGATVLGLVTVPEDSVGLLRQAASMIESGAHAPFWLIGFALLSWAGWDVWTWFGERRKSQKQAASSSPLPTQKSEAALPSTLIKGVPELERCREALVKYMGLPTGRLSDIPARIAGSAELYPYMTDLCRVLDEQKIPHPEIDWDATTIIATGKWSRFLGELWAVRHNIDAARRVYQGGRRS